MYTFAATDAPAAAPSALGAERSVSLSAGPRSARICAQLSPRARARLRSMLVAPPSGCGGCWTTGGAAAGAAGVSLGVAADPAAAGASAAGIGAGASAAGNGAGTAELGASLRDQTTLPSLNPTRVTRVGVW